MISRRHSFLISGGLLFGPSLSKLPGRTDLLVDLETYLDDKRGPALIFIDLDGFKAVNDTFGHPAGDRCLERVADVLGTIARDRGKVYLYGGDEFVVVLPNFVVSEAATTAERIRSTIQESDPGQGIKVTASIGVASAASTRFATAADLVDAADKAGYASKSAGKNQVTTWPLPPRKP